MKTIFADRVPVGLFNDANLNWHMRPYDMPI